jgi:hypothetical protein
MVSFPIRPRRASTGGSLRRVGNVGHLISPALALVSRR